MIANLNETEEVHLVSSLKSRNSFIRSLVNTHPCMLTI